MGDALGRTDGLGGFQFVHDAGDIDADHRGQAQMVLGRLAHQTQEQGARLGDRADIADFQQAAIDLLDDVVFLRWPDRGRTNPGARVRLVRQDFKRQPGDDVHARPWSVSPPRRK